MVFNPQLKSCGSIEGAGYRRRHQANQHQSATEKLRLHWRKFLISVSGEDFFSRNPQLKSCGSIEGSSVYLDLSRGSTIRNWKVAAPLKALALQKAALSIDLQSATEKLRLHWRKSTQQSSSVLLSTIRNWKVAAPLKVEYPNFPFSQLVFNPQLKSCGSIEGIQDKTISPWPNNNPQLKSCGSIEGSMVRYDAALYSVQSATEKLRLHWRKTYPR